MGIAPSVLIEEEDSVLEELWRSYADRETKWWPWERELLATIAELLHALIRQNAAIWGAKKHEIPEPLKIPRPSLEEDRDDRPKPHVEAVSHAAFILMTGT